MDVQDPGNLGSLIRAAEAGGVTGVIVCGVSANPFSWKALRGSMGSALRLPVSSGNRVDAVLRHAKASGARTIASAARDGRDPDDLDWSGSVVLLLGGEGPGLARRGRGRLRRTRDDSDGARRRVAQRGRCRAASSFTRRGATR